MTNPQKPRAVPKIDLDETKRQDAMRIIADADRATADLLADPRLERRTYPEQDFRRYFLGVFTGEAQRNPPPGYTAKRVTEEARNCWLMVAGSVMAEVDVVNRDGSVAFTIPAMSDSTALNTIQKTEDENMKHMEEEWRHQQGLGAIAERKMIKSLNERLAHISSGEVDVKEAKRKLDIVRKFYGLETDDTEKKDSQETNQGFMGEMIFD